MTPLQRPTQLGSRRNYSDTEVAALIRAAEQAEAQMQRSLDPDRPPPQLGGNIDQTADGNFESVSKDIAQVNGEWRTSLIIDPPDGRLPFRQGYRDLNQTWSELGLLPAAGPEARSVLDRCLAGPSPVPLLTLFYGVVSGNPGGDNPVRNIQIVQNKNYVMIMSEYFSQARIIPLADEFSDPLQLRWMGESIAHYQDNMLVIRSRGFRPEQSTTFMPVSAQFTLTEYYIPVSENELLLRYTAEDPEIYSRPFTAEIPLQRMDEDAKLYEYACHEGNYSMVSILRAERMQELGFYD